MRIKKYTAKSMVDALSRVKKELGENALILSTKKLGKSGEIEVIAALDNQVPARKRAVAESVKQRKAPVTAPVQPAMPAPPQRNYAERVYQEEYYKGKKVSQPQFERIQRPESESAPRIRSRQSQVFGNPMLQKIQRLFEKSGVEKDVVADVVKQFEQSIPQTSFENSNAARVGFVREMARFFHIEETRREVKYPHIIAVVGPTGVGKTTSIAKIASKLMLEKDASVGLISIDTYRIAAVEQLRTFAEIAEMPLKIAFSPQQLQQIMENMNTFDYILIDTTGRSPKNRVFMSELRHFLESIELSEVYLTLSATTRYAELEEIVKHYAQLPFNKIIFTKIDEVINPAVLLNLHKLSYKPLCCVGNGQNIPDDLIKADAAKFSEMIVEAMELETWIS